MSNQSAAFAQLFGQLGQAMQTGSTNAPASHDGANQQFEGAFTQLFGQLGQAMQSRAAEVRVGQVGANTHRDFPLGRHSSSVSGSTSEQTEENTSRQASSRNANSAETGSEDEPSAPDFGIFLRGMATGVARAFENSSGFQEAMSNVGSGISAGLEQAVQNISSSPEFHEFQDAMTNMADMLGNEQSTCPPASEATLQSLPVVKVSDHDLAQGNTSCSICLEKYSVGETALRIPCGHLFHEECCKQWLTNANTCPVCRFELPTDDAAYEQARSARMQTRRQRPRMRHADLSAKSLNELRQLANFLGVDCTGCVEKSDIVNRIATSDTVDIIPESAEHQCAEEQHAEERHATHSTINTEPLSLARLGRMSIREIKAEMTKLDIDSSGCIEKRDLIERLMLSGN